MTTLCLPWFDQEATGFSDLNKTREACNEYLQKGKEMGLHDTGQTEPMLRSD